eukprot:m51a1_g11936 putative calcium-binding protein (193) ;mRNA; f:715257-716114
MGQEQSRKLKKSEIEEISRETKFTPEELEDLHRCFVTLDTDKSGELDRQEFRHLFELRPILKNVKAEQMNALFDAFDTDHSGTVSFKEMAVALSILGKGTKEQKLSYLFDLYDLDKSNSLTRDEVTAILHHMFNVAAALGRTGEKAENFIRGILSKLDPRDSGVVSRQTWISVGSRTPSLLLFLGVIDESDL